MTEDEPTNNAETLDELLSMRGKPFSDWKEERKYLRDKKNPESTNQHLKMLKSHELENCR